MQPLDKQGVPLVIIDGDRFLTHELLQLGGRGGGGGTQATVVRVVPTLALGPARLPPQPSVARVYSAVCCIAVLYPAARTAAKPRLFCLKPYSAQ